MYDVILKGGTLVDGLGGKPETGDIAIQDGKIAAVGGTVSGAAHEVQDVSGAYVTPGWVDVHTHYDGQVTWDDVMDPSASNGVSTVIMGNCGVGFAPVAKGGEPELIELMEGVEDIPGTALYEGMPWGQWESFPEYMDYIAGREYTLDVGAQIAHGALRYYVMGERGKNNEDATADDLARMGQLIEEGMRAGAVGVSTSRTIGHRSLSGTPVPGTFAAEQELMAYAKAMGRAGHGVFEVIPSGAIGDLTQLGGEHSGTLDEIDMMARFSLASGLPVTFTLVQVFDYPDLWREALQRVAEHNKRGAMLRPQVCSRPIGMIAGLTGYHGFMRRETFLKLADLPLEQRVAELRKPEVKAAILADKDIPHPQAGSMNNVYGAFQQALPMMFKMKEPMDYEPDPAKESFAALAKQSNQTMEEIMYDFLLEDGGHSFAILLGGNYLNGTFEVMREMLLDTNTVVGLSDAGAHVGLIIDGAMPTYQLSHWVRDRSRGPKLPIEFLVAKQTANNAALYGLHDRGSLTVGKRADVNIIDLENVRVGVPRVHYDLPAGGRRIMQPVQGYVGCFVNGVQTRANDEDTGARPGRLVRGGRVAQRVAAE